MKTTASRLSVVVGVVVLAIGLSLKREGAPSAPHKEGAGDKLSSGVSRETTNTNVTATSTIQTAPSVAAGDPTRVKVGTIPTTGLPVIATIEVDWRDDEGTRLRQAGKLIGPMPNPALHPGGGATGGCTFNIHCDDANPCTIDTC